MYRSAFRRIGSIGRLLPEELDDEDEVSLGEEDISKLHYNWYTEKSVVVHQGGIDDARVGFNCYQTL